MSRARFVAREYAWLDPGREQLFSPASLLVRILPSLHMRTQSWVSMSLDVADAFLTVPQVIDTVVKTVVKGKVQYYKLLKMLPGQRDGTSNWHDAFTGFCLGFSSLVDLGTPNGHHQCSGDRKIAFPAL